MLYGYQLLNSLSNLISCRHVSVDVFGFDDELPIPTKLPCGYIINSDKISEEKYTHWFVVYVDELKNVYYFDSFGIILDPIYRKIKQWGNVFSEVQYNRSVLQCFDSFVCGCYCVCFIYFLSQGKTFPGFLSLFTDDCLYNDSLALNLFNQITSYG